jgi:hypothetical protein
MRKKKVGQLTFIAISSYFTWGRTSKVRESSVAIVSFKFRNTNRITEQSEEEEEEEE